MFFGVWNVRGPKEQMKQREVRKLILEHKLSLVGLVETKIKEVNKEGVLRSVASGWNVLCNYKNSPRGRIGVCWVLMLTLLLEKGEGLRKVKPFC